MTSTGYAHTRTFNLIDSFSMTFGFKEKDLQEKTFSYPMLWTFPPPADFIVPLFLFARSFQSRSHTLFLLLSVTELLFSFRMFLLLSCVTSFVNCPAAGVALLYDTQGRKGYVDSSDSRIVRLTTLVSLVPNDSRTACESREAVAQHC